MGVFIGVILFFMWIYGIVITVVLSVLWSQVKRQEQAIRELKQGFVPPKTTPATQPVVPPIQPQKQPSTVQVEPPLVAPIQPVVKPAAAPKQGIQIEKIISKLGIILLLIGVGYLFKLAFDQGFLTENILVIMGVLIGISLIGLGFFTDRKGRVVLGQMLKGGGIATLYMSLFAGYQVYGLMGHGLALLMLVAVSVLALILALQKSQVAIAMVSFIGGIATPFVIDLSYIGVIGIGIYVLILSMVSMGIFYYKRWYTLMVTTVFGVVLATSMMMRGVHTSVQEGQLSLLILALFLLFNGVLYAMGEPEEKQYRGFSLVVLITSPLVSLMQITYLMTLDAYIWAIGFLIVAIGYGVWTFWLHSRDNQSWFARLTLSLATGFAVLSIMAHMDLNIQGLLVVFMAYLFYKIHGAALTTWMKGIGTCLLSIGYILVFVHLIQTLVIRDWTVQNLVPMALFLIIATGILYLQGKLLQGIFSVLIYALYAGVLIINWIPYIAPEPYVHSMTLGVFMLFTAVIYGLYKRFQCLPLWLFMIQLGLVWMVKVINGAHPFRPSYVLAFLLFFGLGHLNRHTKIGRYLTYGAFATLAYFALVDFSIWQNYLGYGILAFAGLMIVLKQENLIFKGVWLFSLLILMVLGGQSFQWLHLGTVFILLVLLYRYLTTFHLPKWGLLALHGGVTFVLMAQTITNQYPWAVTLIFAAYALLGIWWAMAIGDIKVVRIGLLFVLFVMAKFVLLDLSRLDIVWKILIAMAFGSGLLLLSFFLEPWLKAKEFKKGV